MIHTMTLGRARISSVLEYAAPTHDPAALFPDLAQSDLDSLADQIAPHHYIPAMNRLIVSIRLWVVQMDGRVIVIDTGVGNEKPRAAARMNMLNNRVPEWLEAVGAGFDQVTDVVMTHLHMDHTGWNTVRNDAGEWVPAFKNARYTIPEQDFRHYEEKLRNGPDPIMDDSWTDSILPIQKAGLLDLLSPDATLAAGLLRPDPVPGHTPGMTGYHLDTGAGEVFFCGDVFHSPLQILRPDLNTAYCALPEQARLTRARVLEETAASGALLCPMHFGVPHCGYVQKDGPGYRLRGFDWPALDLAAMPAGSARHA